MTGRKAGKEAGVIRRGGRLVVLFVALAGAQFSAEARATPGNPDAGATVPDAGAGDLGAPPSDAAPALRIRVTGTALVAESTVLDAIGPPPPPDADLASWGEQASQRIVEAYHSRGYLYARAWFSATKQPGVLWFDVDEGRMRVSFVGMSSITATLFRLRLDLPGGVFRKSDFERSLAEQKRAFGLRAVYYRVHELEGYEMTVFGQVVPARTLEIHVVRRESFGWALDVSVSASWGVVPSLKYSDTDLFWHDDRLVVDFDLAVPYRRYIFDAAPRFTWVHGGIAAAYRLPHFAVGPLDFLGFAPRLDSSLYVSQYARADLHLSSFYLLREVSLANLVSTWSALELSLGLGVDLARVFSLQDAPTPAGADPPTQPSDVYSARGLTRGSAKWTSALPWARRDQRTFVNFVVDFCLPLEMRSTLWGQYLVVRGRHRFFVRGRAVALFGQVPFWDDVELAGDNQRVFFGDLYWAHQAAQLELAYHIRLWRDWFELGVFHDLTAFEDRISMPAAPRLMDAFGPSLHFLILDQYALGLYQGLGFAPGRFGQTVSFTLESVF